MRTSNDPLMPRNSRGTQFTPFFLHYFLSGFVEEKHEKFKKTRKIQNTQLKRYSRSQIG